MFRHLKALLTQSPDDREARFIQERIGFIRSCILAVCKDLNLEPATIPTYGELELLANRDDADALFEYQLTGIDVAAYLCTRGEITREQFEFLDHAVYTLTTSLETPAVV